MLLGLAKQVAMRIGLHQDPRHFVMSPWISEMRRRQWRHLVLLDDQAFNGEGFESGLDLVGCDDVLRPVNADDSGWAASRFAKPDSAPAEQDGFTEMTFVIVRDELFETGRRITKSSSLEVSSRELHRLVDETESRLRRKFLNQVDSTDPFQAVTLSYFKANIANLRLLVELVAAKQKKAPDVVQRPQ